MQFFYNADGTPLYFTYNGTEYFYVTNLQGDVMGIANGNGNVGYYEYDAWGKILSYSGIGSTDYSAITYNPLRYRGYIYDNETGFYYLQSRYYDPSIRRFINADGMMAGTGSLQGHNLFAYCFNNPVKLSDDSGNWPRWFPAAVVIVLDVVLATVIGSNLISKLNSKHNSAVDDDPATTTKNQIINDQNGATGNNFEYGMYSASWNACETIAVHNAKILKGMDSSLSETMKDFQSAGAMIEFGYFGSNPYAIGRVLKKEGIEYSRVGLNEMSQNGTYIISFWNEGAPWNGLHTVAVSYDGSNYTAYNLYGDGQQHLISLSDYQGRYICGYYIK